MIEIDGSEGEGGGQVLRTAVALSAITCIPVRVIRIRAKRSNPGLQPQHLTSIYAASVISNAKVEGLERGSMSLSFTPGGVRCGEFNFDVGTAGSVSLVIQTILPILSLAPCESVVEVRGGTDVPWSPPIDYMREVFLRLLRHLGVEANIVLLNRGHYPRGGGRVRLIVKPVDKLSPIHAESFGDIREIMGVSFATNLPRHVAVRQAEAARRRLLEAGFSDANITLDTREEPQSSPGSGVVLWSLSSSGLVIGADSLGERGKPAEKVGYEAAEALIEALNSGGALDEHAGDMIIPYLALADGESIFTVSRLTMHAITNIWLIRKILGVSAEVQEGSTVRIRGVGIRRGECYNRPNIG